jgi:MoaA/NifB/PqqE/SkfB family radical SAM enzyme
MLKNAAPTTFPDLIASDFVIPNVSARNLPEVIDDLEARDVLPEYFASPMFALWEITGRCPLDCPFCYNDSPRRTVELDTAELHRIADELARARVFGVYLTGGEPTARRDLLELVAHLAGDGLVVNLITSGWSFTPELARSLVTRVASVSVSLDAGSAAVHDRIRRRRGAFDRALRTVRLLQDRGLREVYVGSAVSAVNVGEVEAIIGICRDIGVRALRMTPIVVTEKGSLNAQIPASREEYERLERSLCGSSTSEMVVQWVDPSGHIRLGRALGRNQILRITAEGHFAVSPYLPYVMGNARSCSIQECWDNGLRTAWRHPRIQRVVRHIESAYDMDEPCGEDPTFTFLDPREARRPCSPTT